jgi:hypothetical protein
MMDRDDKTLYQMVGHLHTLGVDAQTINSLLLKVVGRDMSRLYGLHFRQVLVLRRELQQWISALEQARP